MTDSDSRVIYESEVTHVGGMVEAFLGHGLLIFFQTDSPKELHDMSVLHTASIAEDGPQPGDTVHFGEVSMEILAVGPVVRDNLLNLGHIDFKADGRTEPKLQVTHASASVNSPSSQSGRPSGSRATPLTSPKAI